jgi:hypothetical protein
VATLTRPSPKHLVRLGATNSATTAGLDANSDVAFWEGFLAFEQALDVQLHETVLRPTDVQPEVLLIEDLDLRQNPATPEALLAWGRALPRTGVEKIDLDLDI